MQIVIPMSGFGERFRRAGYEVPKPLIEVEGKPIIAHVIEMFPEETDFIFICNNDHLSAQEFNLKQILNKLCPTGKVIGINAHKLGPIHAVNQISEHLSLHEPIIVNYCDFTCYWDWKDFKNFVKSSNCIGAIPAYKGFHPHTLGSTNYAYMMESNGVVSDIQEKKPYTSNRMEEYASSGTYYFSSAKVMLDAFNSVIENDLNVAGEYYVSLAYRSILQNKSLVLVYPLQHFMQWGTPQDVMEYNGWSQAFRALAIKEKNLNNNKSLGSLVIPMAGLGQRFVDGGYDVTKPLIPVSGMPMVIQAVNDLPNSLTQSFIIRRDMKGYQDVSNQLYETYPNCIIETIDSVTDGQAITASIGMGAMSLGKKLKSPVTIGACDNGAIYNFDKFQSMIEDPEVDIIVWGVRGYANAMRNPEMFGWVKEGDKGLISKISVKMPLEDTSKDPIVLGTFTFKDAGDYSKALNSLIARDGKINGEFYIDSLINDAIQLGFKCKLFEVDSYLCWGTPNDLKTFEYWQSCFHKWSAHPYRIESDSRISIEDAVFLEKENSSKALAYKLGKY